MPLKHLMKKYHEFKHSQPIYSVDWFSENISNWIKLLSEFKNKPNLRFLEIGSYEGRATRWLLDNILTDTTARIFCIDTWVGSMEHKENGVDLDEVKINFLHNIMPHKKKVTYFENTSQEVIRKHPEIFRTHSFDFIYIDGSHTACDVLEDAILSFRILKRDGLMIFDDYQWNAYEDPKLNPKLAIDAWLACFENQYDILMHSYQVCVKKK